MSERPRPVLVAVACLAAVVLDLAVYALGRAAGGSFRFTTAGGPAEVDAVTVAGFSVVPLLAGLTVVAVLAPLGAWVVRVALVVGPSLAVGTIALMTLPADFDTVSTLTLAACHLMLVPVMITGLVAIGRQARRREDHEAGRADLAAAAS